MQKYCVSFVATLIGLAALINVSYAQTYLAAISACPPWKNIPDEAQLSATMLMACQKDVDLIVTGFKNAMTIEDKNIIQLVDKNATYSKVVETLVHYANNLSADDRLVIYVNTHGGIVDGIYKGYHTKDETFVWYTIKRPSSPFKAIADKQWMSFRVFRDFLDEIKIKELVVVADVCHAGEGIHDIKFDNHRYINWDGREAIIFSSSASQTANFTSDMSLAIFSDRLAKSLNKSNGRSLSDVFNEARIETHRMVRNNCKSGKTLKKLRDDIHSYLENCTQMPEAFDPFGLLDDIILN